MIESLPELIDQANRIHAEKMFMMLGTSIIAFASLFTLSLYFGLCWEDGVFMAKRVKERPKCGNDENGSASFRHERVLSLSKTGSVVWLSVGELIRVQFGAIAFRLSRADAVKLEVFLHKHLTAFEESVAAPCCRRRYAIACPLIGGTLMMSRVEVAAFHALMKNAIGVMEKEKHGWQRYELN
jgi:hypothetical protein